MSRLLLLEDDLSLIDGLKYSLEKNGFELDVVRSVRAARERLRERHGYDLLLLDVTLPDGTGFMICDEVRSSGDMTPIIFLTAADEETSIIRGLDSGGDDYITKPFKLGELCSRIRALLRRSTLQSPSDTGVICSGPISIDQTAAKAYLSGEYLDLTGVEYRLLSLLVDDNTLSVYIRRLREKIEENPSRPEHLLTIRGMGYRWEEDSHASSV